MITTAAGYPGKWIPIPCDTNITCSFFCVSEGTLPKNVTVPFNWFTDFTNQSDTEKAGITIKYHTNGSSVLFCPPVAILIKNTCFLFVFVSRRNNGSTFNPDCKEKNATLLKVTWEDYLNSKIVTYLDFMINVTYMPLYLKEGIEEHIKDGLYNTYEWGYDYNLFSPDMDYALVEKKPKKLLRNYERDYGHPLFVRHDDKTLAYLLNFVSLQFKTYFSNVSSPIIPLLTTSFRLGRRYCLLLHPDYLKEMPIFHTWQGFSLQGWRLQTVECSSNNVIDLIICQMEPLIREVGICPVDYYQCQDRSCILSIYVCDGHQDCDSDEQQTECNQTVTLPTVNCPNSDFWLENNHSISGHSVCDGISQCGDEEDELMCHNGNIHKTSNPTRIISGLHEKIKDGIDKLNSGDILSSRPCTFMRNIDKYFSNIDNSHLLHCRHVLCPGMFKCGHSYCIDIVAICDGVVDCPDSEDESSCLNLYCPGMIKCRGETKCVPTWNICDGRSDCVLNQDDEATCYNCPEYCKCNSYYVECILSEMFSRELNNIVIKIMKLIITRDTVDIAFLVNYLDLLYLDISTNRLRNLTNSLNEHNLYKTYLYLFNASGNLLHETYFMSASYFRFIQIIDLSNNKLVNIANIPPKLKILYLNDNLIILIWDQIIPNNHDLHLLDIRDNPLRIIHLVNMMKRLTSLRYFLTSTELYCCILPYNVKCSVDKMICKGLFSLKIVNITFFLFSMVTFLMSFARTIKCIMAQNRNKEGDGEYLILMIHVSLSDTLICFWAVLTCGLFMVTSPSNRNLWRLSALCDNLGVASFIALQVRMYIQLYHKLFVFVKIVFPLKKHHPLTNNTNKTCLLLWLFSALTSVCLRIFVGKLYIHGDLCFFLLTKDGTWGIVSWISLIYFCICITCVILLVTLVSIMCRVIFKSSKTLNDKHIIKKRRHSAIRFALITVLLYSWWLVFSGLIFRGHINVVNSLYQDVLLSTVVIHNILHILETCVGRK